MSELVAVASTMAAVFASSVVVGYKLGARNKAVSEIDSRVRQLESNLAKYRDETQRIMSTYHDEINDLSRSVSVLQDQVNTLTRDVNDLLSQLRDSNKNVMDLSIKVAKLVAELEQLTGRGGGK